jgi:uncharacterized membrane protein
MIRLIAASSLLLFMAITANCEEYIDTYDVDIEILETGDLSITENIRVWAEGQDIKRGIYRWFPLQNVEAYQKNVPYLNLSVTRDGSDEAIAKIDTRFDSIVYYFGDTDVFLPTNKFYDYKISYEVDKAVLQFDESDQLYWNIIPANWEFPIKNVSAKVRFPENAEYTGYEIFSGKFGSETNALDVEVVENAGSIDFQSTQSFYAGTGLSARIKFGPNLLSSADDYPVLNDAYRTALKEAEEQERLAALAAQEEYEREYLKICAIFAGVMFAFLVIVIIIWYRIGRASNVMPTVYPQFYPPNAVSPLAARFILRQGNVDKSKMVTIALVSLASKQIVNLSETSIECVSDDFKSATKGEKLLLKQMGLSKTGDVFDIVEDSKEFASKVTAMGGLLVKFAKKEFSDNVKMNWPIVISLLVAMISAASFSFNLLFSYPFLEMLILFGFLAAGFYFSPVSTLILSFIAFGSFVLGINSIAQTILILLGFAALAVSFYIILTKMKNYTVEGGKIMSDIEGLKMYIKAAEHQTLKGEPEPSAKQFSSLYPYAFAMGLETVWADKFSAKLAQWASAADTRNHAYWYYSRHLMTDNNSSGSLSNFETSFAGAANYSPPSSSGSGFSFSGGSSGGGGGGGGGGGW